MRRPFQKALIVSITLGAISALVFEQLSFGIAHGNLFLVFAFGGTVVARASGLSVASTWSVFGFQFLYFLVCSLAVLAVLAIVRVRRERLQAHQRGVS